MQCFRILVTLPYIFTVMSAVIMVFALKMEVASYSEIFVLFPEVRCITWHKAVILSVDLLQIGVGRSGTGALEGFPASNRTTSAFFCVFVLG